MPQVSQQPSRKAKNKKKDDNNIEPSTNGANKEEIKCCNLCGNIYITKESFVTHMKTDHSIFEMKKKISPSNGFDEYYDRKLPNKVNDELVETLKKVKNKPMPKSRKKILFTNAFEKSLEQQQKLNVRDPAPTTTESNVLYVKLPESHPVIMDSDVMQPPEQPQAPPQLTIGK